MTPENEKLYAAVEKRRGRPLTAAERNIDVAGLQDVLERGKKRLAKAIAAEQVKAVKRWARQDYRGELRVHTTVAMQKILRDLYEAGEKHGHAELARAGYKGYADQGSKIRRLHAVLLQLQAVMGTLNARLLRTTTDLDLSTLSRAAIVRALAKVPGATDVAGRLVSTATYRGLGAAFDQASGLVDEAPQDVTTAPSGGNGWEYTAVMDGATCPNCASKDGTTYPTWAEGEHDLPGGGPNPSCRGDGRCRCRLAPVPL